MVNINLIGMLPNKNYYRKKNNLLILEPKLEVHSMNILHLINTKLRKN